MTMKRRHRQRIRLTPPDLLLIMAGVGIAVVLLTVGLVRGIRTAAMTETTIEQPEEPVTRIVANVQEPVNRAAAVTAEPTAGVIRLEIEETPAPTTTEPDDGKEQHGSFRCTAEDYDWLLKCTQAEQGDFSYRASYLTACCIINRSLSSGMTFTDVIFEENQFEVVAKGWIYDAEPSEQTIQAVNDALLHPETWVTAFSVGHLHDSWATPVEVIETPWGTTEVFYTFKY